MPLEKRVAASLLRQMSLGLPEPSPDLGGEPGPHSSPVLQGSWCRSLCTQLGRVGCSGCQPPVPGGISLSWPSPFPWLQMSPTLAHVPTSQHCPSFPPAAVLWGVPWPSSLHLYFMSLVQVVRGCGCPNCEGKGCWCRQGSLMGHLKDRMLGQGAEMGPVCTRGFLEMGCSIMRGLCCIQG